MGEIKADGRQASDLAAAEAAFRAFHQGSNADWNLLSELGRAQWIRAAKAARSA